MPKKVIGTTSNTFDESSMKDISGLTHIRFKPEYHGYTNILDRSHHKQIARELIDNAIDEMKDNEAEGRFVILYFDDRERHTYQFLLWDQGRGIPIGSDILKNVYMKIGITSKTTVGRKSEKRTRFKYAAGQFGAGAKATAAFSKHFKAISFRPDGHGYLKLYEGNNEPEMYYVDKTVLPVSTGVLVAYEPDPEIFTDIPEQAQGGYLVTDIYDLLYKTAIFNRDADIKMFRIGKGLDPDYWSWDPMQCVAYVEKMLRATATVTAQLFDSMTDVDITKASKYLWPEISKPIWAMHLQKSFSECTHDIHLIYTLDMPKVAKGTLIMVNGVELADMNCTVIDSVQTAIKKNLSKFITDKSLNQWFLEHYYIAFYSIMSIQYTEVRYTTASKVGFRDPSYGRLLVDILERELEQYDDTTWVRLYDAICEDVQHKYELYFQRGVQSSSGRGDMWNLRRFKQFKPAKKEDPEKTELFLVEGDSAGGSTEHRDDYHAFYFLRGKITNVAKRMDDSEDLITAINTLNKSDICKDLMTILRTTPQSPDLRNCPYRYITIMADADSDGSHIAALVIGVLYAINTKFLEEGRVRIATPPLYALAIGKSADKVFLRDYSALRDIRIRNIYQHELNLYVHTPVLDPKTGQFNYEIQEAEGERFREVACAILHMGELITRVAKTLGIPPFILEILTHCSGYLTPDQLNNGACEVINSYFTDATVFYDADNHVLVLQHGYTEYYAPLTGIQEAMYATLLPELRKFMWNRIFYGVSSKTNALGHMNTMMSITQIYALFMKMDSIFKVPRYKGLGEMNPQEVYHTCMNNSTRAYRTVQNIGDVQRIFSLLGVDTTERKRIVQR